MMQLANPILLVLLCMATWILKGVHVLQHLWFLYRLYIGLIGTGLRCINALR